MIHSAVRVIISISKDCSAIIFRFKQSEKKICPCREIRVHYLNEIYVSGGLMCTRQGHSIHSDDRENGGWEGGRQVRTHLCSEKLTFLCQWGYGKSMESHYFRSHKSYKHFFPAVLRTMIS